MLTEKAHFLDKGTAMADGECTQRKPEEPHGR